MRLSLRNADPLAVCSLRRAAVCGGTIPCVGRLLPAVEPIAILRAG